MAENTKTVEKFEEITARRIDNLHRDARLLANCAGYPYEEAHKKQVIDQMNIATKTVVDAFNGKKVIKTGFRFLKQLNQKPDHQPGQKP